MHNRSAQCNNLHLIHLGKLNHSIPMIRSLKHLAAMSCLDCEKQKITKFTLYGRLKSVHIFPVQNGIEEQF